MEKNMGERLKSLRESNKMTLEEVGKKIGKTRAAINTYELNIHEPPIDVIMKLAAIYGVSSDYILNNKADKLKIESGGLDTSQVALMLEIDQLLIKLLKTKHGGKHDISIWPEIKNVEET